MYPTWELFNPLAFYFYLFEIPARYCSEILRHTGAFTVTQWIWICGQHELKLCLIPLYLPRRGRSFTLASLSYGTCVLPLEKFVLKSIDSLAKQKVHPLTTNIALVSCRRPPPPSSPWGDTGIKTCFCVFTAALEQHHDHHPLSPHAGASEFISNTRR